MSGGLRFGIPLFLAGILAGVLCIIGMLAWLIVGSVAQQAWMAVVLGGEGGSRLRKGIELYEQGIVAGLVLVDEKEKYWDTRLARQCRTARPG